jgi:PAS domain S-box-containing protein
MVNNDFKILAIDDNPDNLVSLTALIKEKFAEATIVTANSGAEGLELAAEEFPDVILLDIVMPVMDGYEVCQKIKADEKLNTIPVVFVTAIKDDKESRIRALEAGADGFLGKPLEESELVAQLKAMVKIRNSNFDKLKKEELLEILVAKKTKELSISHTAAVNLLEDLKSEIDRRKLMEAALQQSEKKYRMLVEGLPDAIVIYRKGKINFVNGSALQLVYATVKEELIGKSVLQFVHPDSMKVVKERMKEMNSGVSEIPVIEEKFLRLDGSEIDVEVKATSVIFENKASVQLIIRDVSERRQVLDALSLSEKRYKTLFEKASNGILIMNTDGGIVNVNESFAELHGYTVDEMMQMNLKELDTPEMAKMLPKKIGLVIAGETLHLETDHIHKDGRIVTFDVSTSLIEVGSEKYIQAFHTDITDRKKAEDKLRQLSQAVEQSPATIVITDTNGDIQYVNEKFVETTGYSLMEVMGKNPRILKSGYTSSDEYKELWQTIIAGKEWYGEFHNKKKNGDFFWESASISPIINTKGETTHFLAVKEDITERKIIREALMKSRQGYKELLENMNDGFIVDDISGRIVFANKKFLEVFGFEAGEIEKIKIEDYVAPGYREILRDRHECRLAGEKVLDTFEYEGLRKDGKKIWLEAHVNPIFENGIITGTQSIIRDISERKIADEKLKRFADELMVSNAELERFAYVTSHDLKEPLRMVNSFLNLLVEELDEQLNETTREYIRFAVDGAIRMKTLINDLLMYSRVGTNKDQFTATDTNEIMEYVNLVLKEDIEKNQAEIIVKTLPVITANKTLIGQLFTNLVGNALKYHGDRKPVIEIGCMDKQDEFIFHVRDNGIGIESRFFEKIFIIFQRLHGINEFSGTGIGLAVCKKIVEIHHGKIWVESELGKGSTFYFSLPTRQAGIPKQNG